MDEQPWAQAFGLLGFMGWCCAWRTVVEGIQVTPPGGGDQVEAWGRIGECLSRIADAGGSVH